MSRDPAGGVDIRIGLAYQRLTRALDRGRYLWLLGLTVLFAATITVRARATPFWHDEIYTLLLARLPTTADVWRAAKAGVDLTPPLNVLLTRIAERLAGAGPVSSRLPALAGFWAMSLIVFHVVRVRSNVVLASAAVLLPWFTQGYRFSYEARGYGVMMGLFALLLWSWSEAARGHRRRFWLPVLAFACAATVWNHYFGVVTFAPIAAGELVRLIKRRTPDWPLWAAAAAGLACCSPLIALVRHASSQGATYWRHAQWTDVDAAYSYLFHNLASIDGWALALVGAAVVGGCVRGGFRRLPDIVPGHEVAAAVLAVLMPAIAVGVGRLSGAFAPRYAMASVVSAAIVLPLTLWWIGRRSGIVEVLLLGVLMTGVVAPSIELFKNPPSFQDPALLRPRLASEARGGEPVVIPGPLQFLQAWYYAAPDVRRNLWYVADPRRSLTYLGTDTADRGFIGLSRWTSLGIKSYADVSAQRSFTLYDDGSGWLPSLLLKDRAQITYLGNESGARISHVVIPAVR